MYTPGFPEADLSLQITLKESFLGRIPSLPEVSHAVFV